MYAIATYKVQLSAWARARKLVSHHKQTDSDVVKLWVTHKKSGVDAWPVTCTWARAKALGLG